MFHNLKLKRKVPEEQMHWRGESVPDFTHQILFTGLVEYYFDVGKKKLQSDLPEISPEVM